MAKVGRKAVTRRSPKPAILAVAIALVAVGAAVWWLGAREDASLACTPTGLHEHASFRVYVENGSVSWNDPVFDFPRSGTLAAHVHLPAEHTIHMEGPGECTTVANFFDVALRSDLSRDALRLDSVTHDGETYRDGEGGRLRFFARSAGGAWSEAPDLPTRQPRDGDRYLVTFGASSPQEIAWQQGTVPEPDPRESPVG